MQTNLTAKKLEEIQSQGTVLKSLYDALTLLQDIGLLDFLKARSTIQVMPDADNHQALATLAAWKGGYSECINDLILFRERYLKDFKPENVPLRDYGALKNAVERGELTKEEADAIQSGQLNKLEKTYRTRSTPKP